MTRNTRTAQAYFTTAGTGTTTIDPKGDFIAAAGTAPEVRRLLTVEESGSAAQSRLIPCSTPRTPNQQASGGEPK